MMKELKYSKQKLEISRAKLKEANRMLDLIIRRTQTVKGKMGPEFAIEDLLQYLNRWKTSSEEWLEKNLNKIHEVSNEIKKEEYGMYD